MSFKKQIYIYWLLCDSDTFSSVEFKEFVHPNEIVSSFTYLDFLL